MSSRSIIDDEEYLLNNLLAVNFSLDYKYSELLAEYDKLKDQLHNCKLFTNMVIHDMRSPTNSIKEGMSQAIANLQQAAKMISQDDPNYNLIWNGEIL